MQKHHLIKDNKIICYFGVEDNYIWFKPTKYTKQYKTFILKNVRKVFNELLEKHEYLYTFSENTQILNKWHRFIGMTKQESFILKGKNWNIWVA